MDIAARATFGQHLRRWRQQRRLSQLGLALDAGLSARHLSCLETGRALPSREMVLRLVDRLAVPLRERNAALVAAGFAPLYPEHRLDDPAADAARRAIEVLLAAHEPFPALAIDRHWNMVAHNAAVPPLLEGIAAALLAPPVNVLRLSLHPEGLAPRIVNLAAWRGHLFERLRRQIEVSGDGRLTALLHELMAYPAGDAVPGDADTDDLGGLVVPLRLRTAAGELSFIGTVTVFGTPVDVMLSELAIESLFPADAHTAQVLTALQSARGAR